MRRETGQSRPSGIVIARHAQPQGRVVLLVDAEAMEVEVGPADGDLEDPVQVGQEAIGPDREASPITGAPDRALRSGSPGLGLAV